MEIQITNASHREIIDSQICRYVDELISFKTQLSKDQQIPYLVRNEMIVTLDDIISRLVYMKFRNNPDWQCDTQPCK